MNAIGNFWTMQLLEATKTRSQSTTYAKWGTLKGDESGSCGDGVTVTCKEDAAHTPWSWDDVNDSTNYAGELALDPAAVADYYFDGDSFSQQYTRNKYLEQLKKQGFNDNFLPNGWPSQLKLSDLYQKIQ